MTALPDVPRHWADAQSPRRFPATERDRGGRIPRCTHGRVCLGRFHGTRSIPELLKSQGVDSNGFDLGLRTAFRTMV